MRQTVPLAELHSHLWGAITAQGYLDFVLGSETNRDWEPYETYHEQVYGTRTGVEEIVRRAKAGDPVARREFQELYVFAEQDAGSFARFQAKINILKYKRPTYRHGLAEEMHHARGAVEAQVSQGVRYAEQRNMISRHQTSEEAEQTIGGILTVFDEAGEGYQARLAVSLDRDDPWLRWEAVQKAALGPLGHNLTGVDFCFFEEGYPPNQKRDFFAAVSDFNERHPERALAVLYHVGESFEDKSLESAVRWVHEAAELGAHRLGHAISLGVDPELYGEHQRTELVSERIDQLNYDLRHAEGLARHRVEVDVRNIQAELGRLRTLPKDSTARVNYDLERMEEVRRRQNYAMECVKSLGAVVEVCPTSNRRIGGITNPSHHPVHRFIDNNVPFVVGSDDPGIFDVSLADEIEWVVDAAELESDAFDELALRSWRHRSEVLTGRESE